MKMTANISRNIATSWKTVGDRERNVYTQSAYTAVDDDALTGTPQCKPHQLQYIEPQEHIQQTATVEEATKSKGKD